MKPYVSFMLLGAALAASAAVAASPDWPVLEKESLAFLQSYVRIASVNPPADTRETAALVESLLEANGIEAKLYMSGPAGQTNLVARIPGRDRTKKPLLLLNHFDVVPVDRAAWPVDPFAAIIRDGYIWGRGTLDMKGIGTQHMFAMIALKRAGITPSRDIVMLTTADEETNGKLGIQWMIANHYAEIEPEYVLDEGGMGTRDILAKDKLVFGVAVGEKQTTWVRLHARGTAAHGSQPIPDNANLTLLRAIQRALELTPAKPHPVVAEMVANIGAPLAANKYTNALSVNTASLTTLTSGVGNPPKANVIPSSAEATIDCRLLPGVNAPEFISEMKARINDPRVTVELLAEPSDPGVSNSRTPLFAAIRAAILRQHPGAVVTPMLVPFGTDSVKLRMKGVTAYGLTPMVLSLDEMGGMHSDRERLPLAEFHRGLRIFYDVLSSDF